MYVLHFVLPAPSPPTPCTVENLLPLLHSIASEWHSLGEALSLDEDRLDEIFTNNETDEACLRDMLELYEKKSDSQYTWEEIVAVLKKIGQEEIAVKIQSLHVEPCKVVVICTCTYNWSIEGNCPLLRVSTQVLVRGV